MAFKITRSRFFDDKACTIPAFRPRRTHIKTVRSEEEAQAICREFNRNPDGSRNKMPYGLGYDYIEI